jgi:hypothetical protein
LARAEQNHLSDGVYIEGKIANRKNDEKTPILWGKTGVPRDFSCCRVRIRAQNCLFWASFEEKITPMLEYVGKIYINETAKITFEQGRTLPL